MPTFIADLSSISVKDREQLELRMHWINSLRKRGITRGQFAAIQAAIPTIVEKVKGSRIPSVSTLVVWMRRFDLSGGNPAAVLSLNRCRKRPSTVHPLVEEEIQKKLRNVYLTNARFTLRHVHEQIQLSLKKHVQTNKLTPAQTKVSLATISRRLSQIDKYEIDKARFGPGYARAKHRTSVEGTLAERALQRLECDHTLLNWVVVCDRTGLPLGRPTLTIVVDAMSGYVVGLYVSFHGPGITSVLNVIKNAIAPKDELTKAAGTKQPWIAFGIGETLVLDNGLEFHSKVFKLAAWELGIDLEYCRVRFPWLKPHVERFFANLDHFSLARGRVRKPLANGLNIDPHEDAAIMFSDFVRGLIKFVVDVYPFELNSRKLVTPFDAFQESFNALRPPTFLTSMDQLDLIAAMRTELTVKAGGVEMLGCSYSSPELALIKNQLGHSFRTGVKWNPDDMSFVYVQHPVHSEWLPVPSLNPYYTTGLSWLQHRLIHKFAREKHVQGGGVERLLQARQELHETWMNGVTRRNRSKDIKTSAKFSGMSSNTVLLPDHAPVPLSSKTMVTREDLMSFNVEEIEPFESFAMRSHT
jgi:putative transposase